MHSAHRLCRRFGHAGANPWLPERAVETEVDFGDPREGGEARVILGAIDAERADVVERAVLETEEILAVHEISVRRIRSCVRDDGLVEAGRRRFNHLDAGDKLVVLFRRHLARYENTEMADSRMQRIDDRLSPGDDLVDVVVEVENPVERLLGRSDVITPGAEHDD